MLQEFEIMKNDSNLSLALTDDVCHHCRPLPSLLRLLPLRAPLYLGSLQLSRPLLVDRVGDGHSFLGFR